MLNFGSKRVCRTFVLVREYFCTSKASKLALNLVESVALLAGKWWEIHLRTSTKVLAYYSTRVQILRICTQANGGRKYLLTSTKVQILKQHQENGGRFTCFASLLASTKIQILTQRFARKMAGDSPVSLLCG